MGYDTLMVYQLREAIVALSPREETGVRIVTIPLGSVLRLKGKSEEPGLVDVVWQERQLSVFLQDLESRGALVHRAAQA